MREAFDHDYPPAEWTVDDVAGALRATGEQYPLPTYEDEAVWDDLRTHDLTGPVVEDVLERAADAREEPVPHLPATMYLDYTRTGNRTRYQEAWRTRQRRLGLFVLAESFEREGEYLDPILDYVWAITEQATWAWPAHLGGERIEGLPGIVPDDERTVALFNAGMAKVLAEIDHVLGERLDVPGVAARGRAAFAETDPIHNRLGNTLRNALAARAVSPDLAVPTPAPVGHFEGFGWWIARDDPADPDGLVVAAKAGHNQESHNHNDCGTFVVHYGRESLLTDLGSPTYDRDYFGPDRYTDYLAPRSLGHSVPHVNGCEQASGRYADDDGWYGSEVIERTGDGDETFGVELAGAYPDAAGLDSLRRTITLERSGAGTGPRVTVADDLTFERPENTFESVLVSYFPLEARDGDVIATGERGRATVTADRGADVAVEHLPAAVDDRDVWRARFAREASGGEGSLELTVGVERTE
jgi:hypothetical protein